MFGLPLNDATAYIPRKYRINIKKNWLLAITVGGLFSIGTVAFAQDVNKLIEAVDKEKAVESVDTEKMTDAVSGGEVDYKKGLRRCRHGKSLPVC